MLTRHGAITVMAGTAMAGSRAWSPPAANPGLVNTDRKDNEAKLDGKVYGSLEAVEEFVGGKLSPIPLAAKTLELSDAKHRGEFLRQWRWAVQG